MAPNRKPSLLKLSLPAWVILPVVGIAFTVFPVSLILFPLVVVGYFRHLFGSLHAHPVLQIKKLLRWTAVLHVCLVAVVFALPYGLFVQVLSALWHIWCALFWLTYARGMLGSSESRRVLWFLGWSGMCFALVWVVVGCDTFMWGGVIRADLYHQIFQQATHLRETLFQSKMSPYQLPDSIRQLLEQGPEVWSQVLVGQVVATFYGVWIVAFFFYWNLCDVYAGAVVKRPLFVMFQLPDWTLVLLVGCLGGWVTSRYGGQALQMPEGMADASWAGLIGVLWWYGLEGISVLIRLGAYIRRFWIFFGLAVLVFFDAQVAMAGMMAVGVGVQIRRFIPRKA